MPNALVLINSEIGSEGQVLEVLKGVEGIEIAYVVYGVYDIIAEVKADSMQNLRN